MNYEEMSDPEISALVAKKWFDDVVQHGVNKDGSIYLDRQSEEFLVEFDPCNNPSDAWPIIVENKINTAFNWEYEDIWTAFVALQRHESSGKNPLRAAMICFLKMKDSQHD